MRSATSRRSWLVVVAGLAVALGLPCLWAGRQLDDYAHHVALTRPAALNDLAPRPLDLFNFLDGNPARARRLMDLGLAPWWTLEDVRLAFWRPLAALTHWLDYQLWPDRPELMHAQSLGWYALLVTAAGIAYRQLMGAAWVAGLAALLYAVDDAHGLPVGWLANRNAVLGAVFGVLALWAHDRWQRNGWTPGALVGPAGFALALLSAEASVAIAGYLIAHALLLAPGHAIARLKALIPYGVVVTAWALVHRLLAYGTRGTSAYTDPFVEPLHFLAAAADRGPILLLAQWAWPPAEWYASHSATAALLTWLGALLFLSALGAVLVPLLRQSRMARFWALGQALAIAPACVPFPADSRHLFFVGLGGAGLLACFLAGLLDRAIWVPRRLCWRLPATALAVALVVAHLILSPIRFPLGARGHDAAEAWIAHLAATLPVDSAIAAQELVILNAPDIAIPVYADLRRLVAGQPVPVRTRRLAPADDVVTVTRPDVMTLVVRPARGYFPQPTDRGVRSDRFPMRPGQRVALTGLDIDVRRLTDDGRPLEVAFRFAVPLEHPSLRWLRWHTEGGGRYVAFTPPAVGETFQVR